VEWVETTAKSIEEAKDLALDKLGVDEADAEFEVLEEPRQGLFGRTRGEARVRARVEPKAPRAKDDRRDRKRRKPKSDNKKTAKPAPAAPEAAPTTADESADDAGRAVRSSASDKPRPKSSGRSKRPEKTERKESSMDEVRTCVDEFLTGLVAAFAIDTPVSIDTSDEQIVATIEGKHGLLLGPKARTLDAIQELTRVTAQRTAPSSIRIKVDVGGYRESRRIALGGFAQQAAEKARTEGVDVVLEPMSSADRKIVHDALNDEAGVSTRSAGTDPRRYVVVVPDTTVDASDEALDDDAAEAEPAGD
jgi:spoIIIJ-associated protein